MVTINRLFRLCFKFFKKKVLGVWRQFPHQNLPQICFLQSRRGFTYLCLVRSRKDLSIQMGWIGTRCIFAKILILNAWKWPLKLELLIFLRNGEICFCFLLVVVCILMLYNGIFLEFDFWTIWVLRWKITPLGPHLLGFWRFN